jgi:hypothetical protein
MEGDGERVARPLPALGELRLEPLVADGAHLVADLGQAIIEQIRRLAVGLGGDEQRMQRRRLAGDGDDQRAPCIAGAGRRAIRALAPDEGGGGTGEGCPAQGGAGGGVATGH